MNVLITGAGGGLGRVLAAECARRGFNLFLTDISAPALEAIKTGITRQYNVNVQTQICDLTDGGAVREMLDGAQSRGIEFDMLLNVAGGDIEGGFMDRTTEQISSIVNVNIGATLKITHEALKRRPRNKRFHIVFVSSLASLYPMPLKACYAASKRFLSDFAYALGSELGATGVTVTSLCPGGLATTDEIITCIDAQGFWGNLTTNPLEIVARRTITKALRGRRVYIPGIVNCVLSAAGKLIPRTVIARVIHSRWQKAQITRAACA